MYVNDVPSRDYRRKLFTSNIITYGKCTIDFQHIMKTTITASTTKDIPGDQQKLAQAQSSKTQQDALKYENQCSLHLSSIFTLSSSFARLSLAVVNSATAETSTGQQSRLFP
ncbi:hypothetical protein Leryth_018233 [Lithospermum erythrorhizon]|nr:hypothetical protein Leryth_018233 [Lithospermum erythrorhizon]